MDFFVHKIKIITYHYRLNQKVYYMYRRLKRFPLSLSSQAKDLRWGTDPWLVQQS